MMVFLSKRMIACDEASYLVSLSQDKSLGLKKWWQLKMHLFTCHLCRKYEKQLKQLTIVIDEYRHNCNSDSCQHHLDETSRKEIQGVLDREIGTTN